jgi:hypothetical protein
MAAVRLATVLLAALAGAGVAAGLATAQRSSIGFFKTPSGNIGCIYASAEPGIAASLRCDIRSGLRPKPPRPKRCNLDYGDSLEILTTGRTIVVCHGDTALDPHAPVLGYGKVWRRDGFTCSSKTAGLRCSNRTGHGFFLSREHWYRF